MYDTPAFGQTRWPAATTLAAGGARPELAATLAGELRCLRSIIDVVIAEQMARLR